MSLITDIVFSFKKRCPVCMTGQLFASFVSLTPVEECSECGAKLGQNDMGDGASVFLIFILGFLIVPMALLFEKIVAPPLWAHIVIWGIFGLALILAIMPAVKAYLMLLEYRHRPSGWGEEKEGNKKAR